MLAVTIALVAGTATPGSANHSATFSPAEPQRSGWYGPDYAYGQAFIHQYPNIYDSRIGGNGSVYKGDAPNDRFTCVEAWVDMNHNVHRPADLYVTCQNTWFQWGTAALHNTSNGGPNLSSPLTYAYNFPGEDQSGNKLHRLTICRVDIRNFDRTGSRCGVVFGPAFNPGSLSGQNWDQIRGRNDSNESELINGAIERMWGTINHTLKSVDDIMTTRNGQYKAVMQTDGNLVIYNAHESSVFWHSATYPNAGAKAVMQSDGNFVIYSSGGSPLWATSYCPGFQMVAGASALLEAGQLKVKHPNGSTIWASPTGRTRCG